jgi:hypothetical protein
LKKEKPVLINPIREDPKKFISFDWQESFGKFVKAIGLDPEDRGTQTIRIVGLNSQELMEERAEVALSLSDTVDTMIFFLHINNTNGIKKMSKKIKNLTSSKNRFAGFKRVFFRAHGLKEYVAND